MALWASASVAFRKWRKHRVGPLSGTFIGRLAWQVFLGQREMAAAVVVANEGLLRVFCGTIFSLMIVSTKRQMGTSYYECARVKSSQKRHSY